MGFHNEWNNGIGAVIVANIEIIWSIKNMTYDAEGYIPKVKIGIWSTYTVLSKYVCRLFNQTKNNARNRSEYLHHL